ncbi:hypothetical protein JW979_06360 [bacterium]|nr:hypothetical protein [candidate division CSSED10-310 bacterium]
MSSSDYSADDYCYCNVIICNPDQTVYENIPVFVILDVYGLYYFAPDFSDFNCYIRNIDPGEQLLVVLPGFRWPFGAGSANGIYWYAAMTDQGVENLFGKMGVFSFGWH